MVSALSDPSDKSDPPTDNKGATDSGRAFAV